MRVDELFHLKYGVNLELIRCEQVNKPEGINFVARTSQNNGVTARVKLIDGIEPQKAGTISVAVSGSVLSAFVQNEPYYSGRDLYVLTPKIPMTFEEKLYYAMLISKNAFRYSYGRAANKTLPKIELLPIDDVRDSIKNYRVRQITSKLHASKVHLNIDSWKEFLVSDLFIVKGTKTTTLDNLEEHGPGIYPYVTTQATDNGVAGKYDYYTENGNVLVIDSAVSGHCTYQAKNFSASDHVEKLSPIFKFNKYIGLFVATIINLEKYRYSYGRKSNHTKIKDTIVKLPTTAEGNPDWDFMESCIKSLPYSDHI